MCKEGEHFCSNCGSEVDSGKTGEYKVLDFGINLKKGQIKTYERSVLCKRCLGDPLIKDCLKMLDAVKRMKPLEAVKKQERGEGELGCSRCGKLITPDTPHVALSIAWDVDYHSLDDKQHVMCKECYSRDGKTRAIWKFLAKCGKNPTFAPRLQCGSAHRCATYEPGNNMFGCKNITVKDFTRTEGRGIKKVRIAEHRLACAKCHPRQFRLLARGDHVKIGSGQWTMSTPGKPGKPTQLDNTVKKLGKVVKRMMGNLKSIKDPAMRSIAKNQIDLLRISLGPLGLKL